MKACRGGESDRWGREEEEIKACTGGENDRQGKEEREMKAKGMGVKYVCGC